MSDGIIIAPGKISNLDLTIAQPQKYADIKKLLDKDVISVLDSIGKEEFGIWGISDKLQKRGVFKRIEKGNFILFYSEGKFLYSGLVVARTHNKKLSIDLWPDDVIPSEWVIFIDDIEKIDISLETFVEKIGFKKGYIPQQFARVSDSIEKKLISKYGSIDAAMQAITDNKNQPKGKAFKDSDRTHYWLLGYPRGNMEISIKKGIIGGPNTGRNKLIYEKWYKHEASIGDKMVFYIHDELKVIGTGTISGDYYFDTKIIWPPHESGDVWPHRRNIKVDQSFNKELPIRPHYSNLDLLENARKNGKNLGLSFGRQLQGRPAKEISPHDANILTNGKNRINTSFILTKADFDTCKKASKNRKSNIIKPVHEKFEKQLKPQLMNKLGKKFSNFVTGKPHPSPYVSRPMIQTPPKDISRPYYRENMWIGFAHRQYQDPREGIQLQFGVNEDGVFAGGIWIQNISTKLRKQIFERAKKQLPKLLDLLKTLGKEYYVVNDSNYHYNHLSLDKKFNLNKLNIFLDDFLDNKKDEFEISKEISIKNAIARGTKIVEDIKDDFTKLLPIYDVLADTKEYSVDNNKEVDKANLILFSHLMAGKNLILYGPPGTGKTRKVKEIAKEYGKKCVLRTANAEWTVYNVIGGKTIAREMEVKYSLGFLSEVAKNNEWLIIDELNRANLDLAFGEAFTLLDVEHRNDVLLYKKDYEEAGGTDDLHLPLDFRLLATLNNYDRAILFSLGYAFRRRFAFVEVQSPFKQKHEEFDQIENTKTVGGSNEE